MKKFLLGLSLASTVLMGGAVAATATGGVNAFTLRRLNNSYTCNDIVFSESVSNPGAYADITDLSAKGVTSLDCSMTNWTNANYATTMTASAIKIGGSKSGKYSGSVKLTLNGDMTATRLIIYATGWKGDSGDIQLGVNGDYQSITKTTDSYVYTPYTFDISETNSIILSNNESATGARRLVISKIVLRLYGEQGGGGGSTSEIPPVPGTNTVQVNFADSGYSDQEKLSSIAVGPITITCSTSGNGTKWFNNGSALRVYAGGTWTFSGKTIVAFSLTFGSSDGGNTISTDTGTYDNGSWSGSASSIVMTIGGTSGNRRISAISITYND